MNILDQNHMKKAGYLKTKFRRLIPKAIFTYIRIFQHAWSTIRNRTRSPKTIFNNIYSKNKWGGERNTLYSGSGTHDAKIRSTYLKNIIKYIMNNEIISSQVVFDCGCGDFTIGSNIHSYFDKYIGGDISSILVTKLKEKEKYFPNVEFIEYDLSRDELPKCDIIISRQVLQHLPNRDIQKFVEKLNGFSGLFIFTDHQPIGNFKPNHDSRSFEHTRLFKYKSALILHKKPFCLRFKKKAIIDEVIVEDGVIRTWAYKL